MRFIMTEILEKYGFNLRLYLPTRNIFCYFNLLELMLGVKNNVGSGFLLYFSLYY